MGDGDGLRDSQAKGRRLGAARPALVGPPEPLECVRQEPWREARPTVTDLDHQGRPGNVGRELDLGSPGANRSALSTRLSTA
jgi:hypothetical protein